MIVVCGETLVDLMPDPVDPRTFRARPGGSGGNTAVAAARLGASVAMLTRLSTDGFGRLLREHLAGNGVDLSAAVTAVEPSSVALATVAADGTPSYRFLVDGTSDWAWTDAELALLPTSARIVHTGSLTVAMPPGAAAVERMLDRARQRCLISLDPNVRPAVVPSLIELRESVERCVRGADLVKVSTDDLAALHPTVAPYDVVRRWAASGPGLVVVTDGGRGATALTSEGDEVSEPAVTVDVVDSVGAGDSFAGTLLAWLDRMDRPGPRLSGLPIDDVRLALRLASRAAAITCSRPGADPPYLRELEPTGP